MRVCPKCKQGTSFAKNQLYCKICNKEYRDTHPRERKDIQLKLRYGISLEEYEKRVAAQNGCDICGGECSTGRNLSVDHNHQTGKIRGLLCSKCNQGIGYFRDNIEALQNAINYLRKYK